METLEEISETPMPEHQVLTITIVYDNNPYDDRLKTAWGFAALVEYHDHTMLFDTGGDGPTLLENMRALGIDPTQIERVVLSHAHGDHTGGLNALMETGVHPTVYLPPSFSNSFKRQVERYTSIVEVSPGLSITKGLFTTGEMGQDIPEQALVIQTDQGLVVVTGCAHPGIVAMVDRAREMFNDQVRLVLGGFHLGSKSKGQIDAILRDFRRLEVERVAPCHCTGDQAIAMFAEEYGEDFIQTGAGKIIILGKGED
jgi:7,8-dihydropterin-6-yl-methyl-4-(beta-D-ribofuranosyl)aminobenzene 5'-phosphate synthase